MSSAAPVLRAALFGVALAAIGPAAIAHADTNEDAKAAFDAGQDAFRAGRYGEAGEAFERSARAKPHPASLVNAAEAWELDGNLVRAARACDWALTLETDAALAQAIQKRLARLARAIGTVVFTGDPQVIAKLDGDPVHAGARVRVSRGKHVLTIVRRRGEDTTDLDVEAGGERTLDLEPESTAPPPPQTTASGSAAPPLATWVAFGAGAVSGGLAIGFGVATAGAKRDYEAEPTVDGQNAFYRDRLVTNVAIAVTGIALAAGIVLWIVWPRAARTSALSPLTFRF